MDKAAAEGIVLEVVNAADIQSSVEFYDGNAPIQGACPEYQNMIGVIKSLVAEGLLTMVAPADKKAQTVSSWGLTENGQACLSNGAPEAVVFGAIPEGGISAKDLAAKVGKKVSGPGSGVCMKKKWIKTENKMFVRNVETIEDEVQADMKLIAAGTPLDAKKYKDYKKRKLISEKKRKVWIIGKAEGFTLQRGGPKATDLTEELLKSGEWAKATFKPYNWDSQGSGLSFGTPHPLMKFKAEVRSVLTNMGFDEMPTNRYVESSFWNFDSLFQPQQHPARDAHDTFFLLNPVNCNHIPEEYCNRVKTTHEKGGYGSLGYRYDWKIEEAQKNILRTHTTAVSSRMLAALAQKGEFKPVRHFSIDRVFRNETVDATHLCEFHQVEGFVADRNLTLGHLLGTIKEFFERMGLEDITFKPAFNPYTEPSMEIFAYSKELKKTIEIGNSGMFRPEMLRPMGLPEDVQVIAWGLSLERPTMIKYGIKSIRSIFGPEVRLDLIRSNPICRFD
jgi:phenylalanyl-tRNA synthetase alpha chain